MDQGGRVRECRVHLPKQTHRNYIFMWNNSHWKQTKLTILLHNQGCMKDSCNHIGREEK